MIYTCKLYPFMTSKPQEELIEAKNDHEALQKLLEKHGYKYLDEVDRCSIEIKH